MNRPVGSRARRFRRAAACASIAVVFALLAIGQASGGGERSSVEPAEREGTLWTSPWRR